MSTPHPLQGQTILLTGASRGLGALMARRLCALGAQVIGVARDEAKLTALATELKAQGLVGELLVEPLDLTDLGAVTAWAEGLEARRGEVSAVIHNAGVDDFQPSELASAEHIERQLALNLSAPALINRALLPALLARGSSCRFIHMSSVAGYLPTPFGAIYSASKAGLWAYSEALAVEYAHTPLRFVTLHPAFVHGTGMHELHKEKAGPAPFSLGGTTDEAVVKAALKALLQGEALKSGPIIINRNPTRPLVVLTHLAPRLGRWLMLKLARPYLERVASS